MSDSSDDGGGQAGDIASYRSTLNQMLKELDDIEKKKQAIDSDDSDSERKLTMAYEESAQKAAMLQVNFKKSALKIKARKQNTQRLRSHRNSSEVANGPDIDDEMGASQSANGVKGEASTSAMSSTRTPMVKLVPLSRLMYGTGAAEDKDKPEPLQESTANVRRSQSMSKEVAVDENDDDEVSLSPSKSSSSTPTGKRASRSRQRIEEVVDLVLDDSTDSGSGGARKNNALIVGRRKVSMKSNLPQIQIRNLREGEDDTGSQQSVARSKPSRGGNRTVIETGDDENGHDDDVSVSSQKSSSSTESTARSQRRKSASAKKEPPKNDEHQSTDTNSDVNNSPETKELLSPTRKITMNKNVQQVRISNQQMRDADEIGASSTTSTSAGSSAPSTSSRRGLRDREQPGNESSKVKSRHHDLLNPAAEPSVQLHPLPKNLKSLLKSHNLQKIRSGQKVYTQSSPSPDDSDADRYSNASEKVNNTI